MDINLFGYSDITLYKIYQKGCPKHKYKTKAPPKHKCETCQRAWDAYTMWWDRESWRNDGNQPHT